MNKITVDKSQIEMLSRELGKLQCWLTGYHAGAGHKPNQLGINIPGEDAVRQTKLLFRDMIHEAEAVIVEPETVVEEPAADSEGWIVHDGCGIPCDEEKRVDCKFRDGDVLGDYSAGCWHSDEASESNWVHDGQGHDIMAWRPAK